MAHKLDSDIIHHIIGNKNLPLYSIHDMFIGDLVVTAELMDGMNAYYKNKLGISKEYGYFILK